MRSSGASRRPPASSSASDPPWQSSMTKNGSTPAAGSPGSTSKTATTPGCAAAASDRASRSNRPARTGSPAWFGRRIFTATSRSSRSSRARWTVAIPPEPSGATIRYRPARRAPGAGIRPRLLDALGSGAPPRSPSVRHADRRLSGPSRTVGPPTRPFAVRSRSSRRPGSSRSATVEARSARRAPDDVERIVAAWRLAASATDRAVKQALVGPYTLARAAGRSRHPAPRRRRRTPIIRATIEALAAAGCPLIEIEEPAAVEVGDDERERRRFGDALRTATAGLGDAVHLSLVLTGGNVDAIGAATIFDLPFSSYAFDLIAGPRQLAAHRRGAGRSGDRLRRARSVGGCRRPSGSPRSGPPTTRPRPGVGASSASASPMRRASAGLDARAGTCEGRGRSATAARLAATASPDELAAALDPRAVDIRSAALGKYMPGGRKRSGRRRDRARSARGSGASPCASCTASSG